MVTTIVWVGLVVAVVAFIVDAILWSFVFNKGVDHLTSAADQPQRPPMAPYLIKQFLNTVVFGISLAGLYGFVQAALPPGISGALTFAGLVWVPTVAHASMSNSIFFDKTRAVANGTAWAGLIKLLIATALIHVLMG